MSSKQGSTIRVENITGFRTQRQLTPLDCNVLRKEK